MEINYSYYLNGGSEMISKDKQYRTRNGLEVRIYATDSGGDYPVHGAVKNESGKWKPIRWTRVGLYNIHGPFSKFDLFEVKPRIKRTLWVNLYRAGYGGLHPSKEVADEMTLLDRIACVTVEIDCEEGEGLEEENIS
jgi:hypothetical protein